MSMLITVVLAWAGNRVRKPWLLQGQCWFCLILTVETFFEASIIIIFGTLRCFDYWKCHFGWISLIRTNSLIWTLPKCTMSKSVQITEDALYLYTNDLIWEQWCLSFVNQDVASLIQCNWWKLGIHCLRLPGFNVYTSRDLRPPPSSWKRCSALSWMSWFDKPLGWTCVCTCGIYLLTHSAWEKVCEALSPTRVH